MTESTARHNHRLHGDYQTKISLSGMCRWPLIIGDAVAAPTESIKTEVSHGHVARRDVHMATGARDSRLSRGELGVGLTAPLAPCPYHCVLAGRLSESVWFGTHELQGSLQ